MTISLRPRRCYSSTIGYEAAMLLPSTPSIYTIGGVLGKILYKDTVPQDLWNRQLAGAAERKNSGGLKGSEDGTRIWVEGRVLLWGESSHKL